MLQQLQARKKIASFELLLFVGTVSGAIWAASFIFLFITGYNNALTTEFLSINESAGKCTTIPIKTSASILVDKNGVWETSTKFKSEEALFLLTFTSYSGDSASWVKDMAAVSSVIETEMTYLRSISDLPLKIMHLTSWRKSVLAKMSGEIKIWFHADPS
jgi:hypothetical protein